VPWIPNFTNQRRNPRGKRVRVRHTRHDNRGAAEVAWLMVQAPMEHSNADAPYLRESRTEPLATPAKNLSASSRPGEFHARLGCLARDEARVPTDRAVASGSIWVFERRGQPLREWAGGAKTGDSLDTLTANAAQLVTSVLEEETSRMAALDFVGSVGRAFQSD
jgi:hypothetical protein